MPLCLGKFSYVLFLNDTEFLKTNFSCDLLLLIKAKSERLCGHSWEDAKQQNSQWFSLIMGKSIVYSYRNCKKLGLEGAFYSYTTHSYN
jgi:hypothetical protein